MYRSQNELTWKIGGEAGFGIMVSGLNFAKTCMRAGLSVFEANEYPSIIRGGHNTESVRVSDRGVSSLCEWVDFLASLNRETIDIHKGELSPDAGVLFDSNDYQVTQADFPQAVKLYPVPLLQLAKDNGGDVLMRNTVAIGASLAVAGLDLELLSGVLRDQFKKKGDAVVNQNIATARAGYDYIKQHFPDDFRYKITPVSQNEKKVLINGSEAIGFGAIAAGMKFFASYPMTPINGLLHYLASVQEQAGFIYKQPEDEIAAINMALGASFAGVRSMVATSGGGYALMVEGTSLAGMTELPVVIVYGMRPGPATGLPTWTGQTDLKFVLSAGHGEFPRMILAPSDPEDAFMLTMHAFNLAEEYQSPVFILTDKHINESRKTVSLDNLLGYASSIPIKRGKLLSPDEQMQKDEWNRYDITDDGISPRPIPGRKKGIFRVNSDEHTPDGYSSEDAVNVKAMIEKRMRKLKTAQTEIPEPILYGAQSADITLVGWGSTKGAVLEAFDMLQAEEFPRKINYLHLNWMNPFPSDNVKHILESAKKLVAVEGAHNTPMTDYICEQTGIQIHDHILKYDGRAFYPEDIVRGVKTYV